jgi:hypothetical protein
MCFGSARAAPAIVDPGQRASNAAADAVVARRKDAQGFAWTLGGGATPSTQPSIARAMLGVG